jgi:light-harvesting protein B-800-850 alpha chain
MNQGRIWCVVNPTVGLPLLIGSVAVTSLIVHTAVLSHTSWVGAFFQGGGKAKTAMIEGGAPVASVSTDGKSGLVISVAPAADASTAASSFVVTVTPQGGAGVAKAEALASADTK